MKFFKNLKESILGSIKEDLNSALGGKQALFNSKIAGALDDLIAMKTGINISNIPSKVTQEAAIASEARRKKIKNPDERVNEDGSRVTPSNRLLLRFPTSNDRFIDNWISFRTIPRNFDQEHMAGNAYDVDENAHGINMDAPEGGFGGKKWTAAQKECTIMLYFPNNVKDTISVDYETKDIGLGESVLNEIMSSGGGLIGGLDPVREGFRGMKESMLNATAQQEGVAVANPKFLNYSGVGMREHTYSFSLNPYNEADAEEITDVIYWFKLMSLPMSSNKNPRISILPAEWEINFKGPILGHIEHPQNCFLSTVDVDYSGGKDMSFIESAGADARTREDIDEGKVNVGDIDKKNLKVQHYPNGINLTLTFKEILNIDRLRYVGRVAAVARGKSQDTMSELENFELGRGNRLGEQASKAAEKAATEAAEPVKPRPKLNTTSSMSRVRSRGQINEWNKKYGATHNPDGSPRNAQGNTPRGT
jgi:hypothetical protein